jgi:hypothetical protein
VLTVFKGSTLGALAALGMRIAAAAHLDGVQRAEILLICVISAGSDGAFDAVIDLIHDRFLLF